MIFRYPPCPNFDPRRPLASFQVQVRSSLHLYRESPTEMGRRWLLLSVGARRVHKVGERYACSNRHSSRHRYQSWPTAVSQDIHIAWTQFPTPTSWASYPYALTTIGSSEQCNGDGKTLAKNNSERKDQAEISSSKMPHPLTEFIKFNLVSVWRSKSCQDTFAIRVTTSQKNAAKRALELVDRAALCRAFGYAAVG